MSNWGEKPVIGLSINSFSTARSTVRAGAVLIGPDGMTLPTLFHVVHLDAPPVNPDHPFEILFVWEGEKNKPPPTCHDVYRPVP